LITMAVFALVFGKIAQLETAQINYPLFVLSGLLPWMLFANSLLDTSSSLINNAPMISKVYFPRIILPVSIIMVHFVDFLISSAVLLTLLAFTGTLTLWSFVGFPIFILLTLFLCTGTGLWLAAISVRYRDFRFIVPFLVQFGVFISPVGYSSFLVTENLRWFYFLNPMAGIIEGFRWCCFGVFHVDLPLAIVLSCVMNGAILCSGFRFFRNMERVCADII
jgi:lipopolysaccharide transport system permease protein